MELSEYCGDTVSAAIVGCDESGSSPVHHTELVNEFFGMGVPGSGRILRDWAHVGLVGLFFDGGGTSGEISV